MTELPRLRETDVSRVAIHVHSVGEKLVTRATPVGSNVSPRRRSVVTVSVSDIRKPPETRRPCRVRLADVPVDYKRNCRVTGGKIRVLFTPVILRAQILLRD